MDKAYLVGERVYLRAFERDDIGKDYWKWINDPKVTHYLEAGAFPYNYDELLKYFENNLNNTNAVFFAIIEKEKEKHIGNARIYDINWINRTAQRGIMIGDKDSWSKGFGVEVINLLSDYAFYTLNLNKLKSSTFTDNMGIIKVNERTGYKNEGVSRENVFRDGRYYDTIYWGLLREEYIKIQKNNNNK